ncbi:MAG: 50S ribosomal protein L29 [Gemmatimonadota bacterium]
MQANEIRELSLDEIDEELERTREELFNLRFRASYEELENPSLMRELRRNVARFMTIRAEVAAGADDE